MSKPPERHPQGVFETTFDGPHGGGVLVAVNSEGRAVAYAMVRPSSDRPRVVRALRVIADANSPSHPPPGLHLMR